MIYSYEENYKDNDYDNLSLSFFYGISETLSLKELYYQESNNIKNEKEKSKINNSKNRNNEKKLLNDKNNLIIQKQKKISKSSKEINNYGKAKKKREKNKIGHNKYSDDNLRMKCKYLVLKHLRNFLNDKIRVIYNGNIGKGLFEKQLKIINQSQTRNGTVNFNKNFLNAKIKNIFSIDINYILIIKLIDFNK